MNNKDTYEQIINGYNNQLLHWDARKRVLDEMIKDLNAQYTTACNAWEGAWRERQQYINEKEEKDSLDNIQKVCNQSTQEDLYA